MPAIIDASNSQCSLNCLYCTVKENQETSPEPSIKQLKKKLCDYHSPFTLGGGDPLLLPPKQLKKLLKWGYKRNGMSFLQTNGVHLTPRHLSLMKRYLAVVQISLDGPGELNSLKQADNEELTLKAAQRSREAAETLLRERVPLSLKVTLHNQNARGKELQKLCHWLDEMKDRGLSFLRLDLFHCDDALLMEKYALTSEEALTAFNALKKLRDGEDFIIDLFSDLNSLLSGDDNHISCGFKGCNIFNSQLTLNSQGERIPCHKCKKYKKESPLKGYDRYLWLYRTPQCQGGCKGCRFFLLCKGFCPGTAMNQEWMQRSVHCHILYPLFENAEKDHKYPLSTHPFRTIIEERMAGYWQKGLNPSLTLLLKDMGITVEK